jgi:Flp pilus assembly protein TadG
MHCKGWNTMTRFRVFRKQRDGESGAAIVEMAIVLPLLILLVFGIVEYGLLFKEKLTVAAATTSAARTGATMGTQETADIRILEAIEAGLFDQVDSSVLISVQIFSASPTTGAQILGLTNTYNFTPLTACRWTPCPDPTDPTFAYGGSWTPDVRDTTLEPGGGGVEVLGIKVRYHHTSVTDIIPGVDRDLTEIARIRLEPDVFGL